MSRCGRTQSLEAAVMGEVPHAAAIELYTHAQHCAVCRHELQWLESERVLFRQRSGREEVDHVWKAVVERRSLQEKVRRGSRTVVAFATAAAVLIFGVHLTSQPMKLAADVRAEETFESSSLMSPVLFIEREEACSRLPSGIGFQCSPTLPTSVLASR